MKRIIYIISIMSPLIFLTGCSNTSSEEKTPNPILEKIYMHNTPLEHTFEFDFIKFYDDNTFQGIETSGKSKTTNYYGTYTIDGNALTINISDNSYAGAVLDEGSIITFGNDEFVDWTEHIKDTDPILEKFK